MRIRHINFLNEILIEQMNHWMLFPGVLTVVCLVERYKGHAGVYFLLWAICGLFPLMFYFIRFRARGFFASLISHLTAAAPIPFCIYLLNGSTAFIICAASAVGYMIYSLWICLFEDKPYTAPIHPFAGFLSAAASLLLLRYQEISGWDIFFVLPLVWTLALYALTLYIRKYLEFLSVNESSAGYLPAKDMFHSGFALASTFVVICTVFLLLVVNIGNYNSLFSGLKEQGYYLLKDRFTLQQKQTDRPPMEEAQMSGMENPPQIEQKEDSGLGWSILETALYGIVSLALSLAIVIFLLRLIKFLRHGFGHRQRWQISEQELEEDLDVREKCGIESVPLKRRRMTELLSPAQRIRRLYKKRVLASARELTDGNLHKLRIFTPKECGRRLEEEQMAQIYEQVRYSDREATADTLRDMKIALRHRGHSAEE